MYFCLIIFIFSLLIGVTTAVTTSVSNNQEVEEGRDAYYYVKVTNDDQNYLLGMDVKVEVSQDRSFVEGTHTQFHLEYTETDYAHFYVNTIGMGGQRIQTTFTIYVKGQTDDDYSQIANSTVYTTVTRSITSSEEHEFQNRANIFLAVGGVSLLGLIAYLIQSKKGIHLSVIRGYSNIRPERVLENENRRQIFEIIGECEDGIPLKEIKERSGISHSYLIEYHLKKLMDHKYVKKVDKDYYLTGVNTAQPFLGQINEAIQNGAETPEQVAKSINSYREKVRYHMKKHNLLR
jgi:predicted transcriptional regulator